MLAHHLSFVTDPWAFPKARRWWPVLCNGRSFLLHLKPEVKIGFQAKKEYKKSVQRSEAMFLVTLKSLAT